jgi:hypothetical protein
MVDCRDVYDKTIQVNNKDLAQLIKDTSVLRILPTTAHQATILKVKYWIVKSFELSLPQDNSF